MTRLLIRTTSVSCLIVISFLGILAQPVSEAVPANVKVITGKDAPVQVSIDRITRFNSNFNIVGYSIENLSAKPIWGVATKGMPGKANFVNFFPNSIQPGKTSGGTAQLDVELTGDIRVETDAVIFLEGTMWGPNSTGHGDFLKGAHAGHLKLIRDIEEQLKNSDEASIREFVRRQPYLPEHTRMANKTNYDIGLVRAYGAELIVFVHDLDARGDIGAISNRLAILKEQMGLGLPTKDSRRIGKSLHLGSPEPLKIERVEVNGQGLGLNDEFKNGDDWLRGVVVTLSNRSDKEIVSFSLNFGFPESRSVGNMMMYSTTYGRHPGMRAEVRIAEKPRVAPNSSVQISLTGEEFERLNKFISSQQPLASVTRAEIGIGAVYFEDGTRWSMGTISKQDPKDPNRWMPIGKAN